MATIRRLCLEGIQFREGDRPFPKLVEEFRQAGVEEMQPLPSFIPPGILAPRKAIGQESAQFLAVHRTGRVNMLPRVAQEITNDFVDEDIRFAIANARQPLNKSDGHITRKRTESSF